MLFFPQKMQDLERSDAMACFAPVQQAISKPQVLSKAVVNTAIYLELPKVKLARILGVSSATVTRLYTDQYRLSPDKKEWDFAALLVRLFRSLDSIVGGVADDARKWLASENKAFAGKKPIELIDSPEGLVRVVTDLDACRAVV
jgi:putative toxin-antitoxin system antitoxin component (TIGR02293 family)